MQLEQIFDGKKLEDYGVNWKGPINISESMAEIKSEAMFIHFSSMLVCRMGHKPQDMYASTIQILYMENQKLSQNKFWRTLKKISTDDFKANNSLG